MVGFSKPGWAQSQADIFTQVPPLTEPEYTDYVNELVGGLIAEPPYCRSCGERGCYCACED